MMNYNGKWYVESNIAKSRANRRLMKNHLKSLCGLQNAIQISGLQSSELSLIVESFTNVLNFSLCLLIQMEGIDANSISRALKQVAPQLGKPQIITSMTIKEK